MKGDKRLITRKAFLLDRKETRGGRIMLYREKRRYRQGWGAITLESGPAYPWDRQSLGRALEPRLRSEELSLFKDSVCFVDSASV
jgi:hypothetical protein